MKTINIDRSIDYLPKEHPKRKLADFIDEEKKDINKIRGGQYLFGKRIEWEDPAWELTGALKDKIGIRYLNFTAENPERGKGRGDNRGSHFNKYKKMHKNWEDFAKAYASYSVSNRSSLGSLTYILNSIRQLYAIATNKGNNVVCVTELTNQHFQVAINQIKQNYENETTRFTYASYLGILARVLSSDAHHYKTGKPSPNLLDLDLQIYNPFKLEDNHSLTEASFKKKQEKMPSLEERQCVQQAYVNAKTPIEEVITSILAITYIDPVRINEFFKLQPDCLYYGWRNEEGKKRLSFNWQNSKKGKKTNQTIPETHEFLARDSIAKIKKHSDEARAIAKWYENKNNHGLYIPPKLKKVKYFK